MPCTPRQRPLVTWCGKPVFDPETVEVDLTPTGGTATFEVEDLHLKDYGYLENGITGDGPPPIPAVASFKVQWEASGLPVHFDNPAQKYRGDFFTGATAQIWDQISTVDFDIESAPLEDSTTEAAQVGQESNGSFY